MLKCLLISRQDDLDRLKMTSLTGECKDDPPGVASSVLLGHDVQQQDGGSEISDVNTSSKSRRRRDVADEAREAKNQATQPSTASSDHLSGKELPLSTSAKEQTVRSAVEKLATSGGKETAAKVGSGRGSAVRGAKAELAAPGRSRSRDRRLSMSIIDTVFRRRRRQSLAPSVQESSDSEVSTDLSATTTSTSTGTQLRYFSH